MGGPPPGMGGGPRIFTCIDTTGELARVVYLAAVGVPVRRHARVLVVHDSLANRSCLSKCIPVLSTLVRRPPTPDAFLKWLALPVHFSEDLVRCKCGQPEIFDDLWVVLVFQGDVDICRLQATLVSKSHVAMEVTLLPLGCKESSSLVVGMFSVQGLRCLLDMGYVRVS